ncbi:MAG: hypothetical protein LBV67_03610 [Streptococcaceae bacterium]|jgi:hypothetical protein|nr:hypothetical protein [Streptococcaceae bacterium]
MSLRSFLFKKIIKNKFNYIPIAMLVFLISLVLFFNWRAETFGGQLAQLQLIKESHQTNISYLKEELLSLDKDSKKYEEIRIEIIKSEDIFKKSKEAINNLKKEDWKNANENHADILKKTSQEMLNKGEATQEFTTYNANQILILEDISQKNIQYQNFYSDLKATNFLFTLMNIYFPFFITITIIFVICGLFEKRYIQRMDIFSVFAKSKPTITFLISAFIVSCVIFAIAILYSFLISFLLFDSGSLRYPIVSYEELTGNSYLQSIGATILPVVVLTFLSILFLVLFVYLLCTSLRDKIASLFLSLLLSVGVMGLTQIVVPLQQIAKYLPTTYFRSASIVIGHFQYNNHQLDITFMSGVICLSAWCLILVMLLKILTILRPNY